MIKIFIILFVLVAFSFSNDLFIPSTPEEVSQFWKNNSFSIKSMPYPNIYHKVIKEYLDNIFESANTTNHIKKLIWFAVYSDEQAEEISDRFENLLFKKEKLFRSAFKQMSVPTQDTFRAFCSTMSNIKLLKSKYGDINLCNKSQMTK